MSASTKQKTQRPLSPHLQVYRPQMTSVLSILHRLTGVALAVGLVMFSWWLIAAATGSEAYSVFTSFAGSTIGMLMLFGWSAALYFHLANGIRHLVWDSGRMFKLKHAYASGYFVLFLTVLMTGLTWACIFYHA